MKVSTDKIVFINIYTLYEFSILNQTLLNRLTVSSAFSVVQVLSWKSKLPLQTIMRLLQVLVPQVEKICIDKYGNVQTFIDIINFFLCDAKNG